jgi:hypothetical protein
MRIDDEIPLLLMSIYLFRCVESYRKVLVSSIEDVCLHASARGERQSLVGSLAGAAHLLNDNTGVLRGAQ